MRLSKALRNNFERSVCENNSPELSEKIVVWPFGKRVQEDNMTMGDGITFAPRRPRNLADEFASIANQEGKERASGTYIVHQQIVRVAKFKDPIRDPGISRHN